MLGSKGNTLTSSALFFGTIYTVATQVIALNLF